jgi:hypothetical protein
MYTKLSDNTVQYFTPHSFIGILEVWLTDILSHYIPMFSPVYDKCKISAQWFVRYVEIHTDEQQSFLLSMKLTLRAEYWTNFVCRW